jgi:hypothetical protein
MARSRARANREYGRNEHARIAGCSSHIVRQLGKFLRHDFKFLDSEVAHLLQREAPLRAMRPETCRAVRNNLALRALDFIWHIENF